MNLPFFAFAIVMGATSSLAKDNIRERMLSFNTPTPSPQPSLCTGNTPGWVDVDGFGCSWWEQVDLPGCPKYGDDYEGSMGTANDNCCYCFGTGAPTPYTTYPPFPTYPPTVSRAPTTPYPTWSPTATRPPHTPYPTWHPWSTFPTMVPAPTPKPSSPCDGSTKDWVDVDGYGCEWYEAYDSQGCPEYGDLFGGDMGVANDNCCWCFGTAAPVVSPAPTPYPSYPPTVSRAPSTPYPTWSPVPPTPKPTPPCDDSTPDWVDSFGDPCEWYEAYDTQGCPAYGDMYKGDMGTANENCCWCKMDVV